MINLTTKRALEKIAKLERDLAAYKQSSAQDILELRQSIGKEKRINKSLQGKLSTKSRKLKTAQTALLKKKEAAQTSLLSLLPDINIQNS